ncbi:MAG: HEAT repeat domain-containing protein [Kofleriaceae bacterium]
MPPTPSPATLRGPSPYRAEDRLALAGRAGERDELVGAIVGDGFRAGLLYGEAGVGKTSLVQAGVIPELIDQGVTVVVADDRLAPADALARQWATRGPGPTPGEAPSAYLARVAAGLGPTELAVFIIDDVDVMLATGGEAVVAELNEVYARVMGRSGGRARFLFACASERVHVLAALERRTGSLFPPTARFELGRWSAGTAAEVLGRVLADAHLGSEAGLVEALGAGLAGERGVSPAELQLAACALRDLRVTSPAALRRLGGATGLWQPWLTAAARAGGDERVGLRILGELVDGPGATAAELAALLAAPAVVVERAVAALADRGVVVPAGAGWQLAHAILTAPVRELTSLDRALARRGHELLGRKAEAGARLTAAELWTIRREGLAAVTPGERAVIERSRRFFRNVGVVAAVVPVAILGALWWAQRGHAYLAVDGRDRVVVRAGRPGLAAFDWLPSSPGFGDVVADPGLSRSMLTADAWRRVRDREVVTELGGWGPALERALEPRLAALTSYASGGDAGPLEVLAKTLETDDALAELLMAIAPVARGSAAEVRVVEAALARPSPAVRHAAIIVAGQAALRTDGAYHDTLVRALSSDDPEQRRVAMTAARRMPAPAARVLFDAALKGQLDPAIRRELLVAVAGAPTADVEPSLDDAAAILADPDAGAILRDQAQGQLRRAIRGERAQAAEAVLAAAKVWGDEQAATEARLFAIKLALDEFDIGTGGAPTLAPAARAALSSKREEVRAAVLPLYARAAPAEAAPEIQRLASERLSRTMRVAVTLAWGELARAHVAAAAPALDKLIKDDSAEVRAAAAEASGFLGRSAQDPLIRLIKIDRIEVAVGACRGLANSAAVGASTNVAVDGIAQLWKRKGRARREAATVFAEMARRSPGPIMNYLVAAARTPEDAALHPIGTAGLCAAANGGNAEARRQLLKVADDPSAEVRRMVIACAADGAQPGASGVAAATRLMRDPDPSIRLEAARVLSQAAGRGGKVSGGVADSLVALVGDGNRDVRAVAIRALAGRAADAPKAAGPALTKAYGTADETERLLLIRAGRAIGTTDLVELAIGDASPLVRVEAVDTALATGERAALIVAAALADADPQVRRAALDRLGRNQDALDPAAIDRALALAIRDPDPELRQIALTTMARVAPKDTVAARLGRALASRAERERAQGAAAVIGLVDRDAPLAVTLLSPLLDDPAHDVRVALVGSLGAAYAAVNSPDQLAQLLAKSERHAMRRLAVAAAFVMLARTEAGRAAALTALGRLAETGPVLARREARLAVGLIEGNADGITFFEQLVP